MSADSPLAALHVNGAQHATNAPSDDVEQQRARLQAEIASANARTLAARHRAEINDVGARAAFRVELAATREKLDEMERLHQAAVSAIRAAAKHEVDQILAQARMMAAGAVSADTPLGQHVE